MSFSNIFDRIGSKLIGLKFVGSSISPDLWIGIIIECFHGLANTFVTIDVLIILMYYIQWDCNHYTFFDMLKINFIMPS